MKILRLETCEIKRTRESEWETIINVNEGMGPLIDMDGNVVKGPVWSGRPTDDQVMDREGCAMMHPAFTRAAVLSEPLRSHFPKSREETLDFQPLIRTRALSSKVLVVAQTRIECAWSAFCDAVPGRDHALECDQVLDYGAKLDEAVARVLFPEFSEVPYAR